MQSVGVRLAAIIDAIGHPIFVKDDQFRFVLLNRAACELVGHPREAMLGKTDYDFFPKEQADFFRKKDIETFSSATPVVIDEEPITDASGKQHILSTTKVPLRENGLVTHVVGIIHDITRLKEIEERLRLSNEMLESRVRERTQELVETQQRLIRQERLAVLGQLSAGLAHQIRNPLGAISNAAFVLRRILDGSADPDAAHALAIILEETDRANRLVSDLVDYASVRSANRQPIDPGELVDRAIRFAKLPAGVRADVAMSHDQVSVDSTQVIEALGNVIRNAVDAMEGKGKLHVHGRVEGAAYAIAISDSGPGILPSIVPHLFQPLVTTKPEGFGLGLATARLLVENQGGTIAVRKATAGASFEIQLPLAKP